MASADSKPALWAASTIDDDAVPGQLRTWLETADQRQKPGLDGLLGGYLLATGESGLAEVMPNVLWSGLVHTPWNHAGDDGFWETLRAQTLALRESTDRALMVVVGCNLFEWGTFLRRIDNFLMDLVVDRGNVERLLDALERRHHPCRAGGDVDVPSGLRREADPGASRSTYILAYGEAAMRRPTEIQIDPTNRTLRSKWILALTRPAPPDALIPANLRVLDSLNLSAARRRRGRSWHGDGVFGR